MAKSVSVTLSKFCLMVGVVSLGLGSLCYAQREVNYPPDEFLKVVTIFTNDIHGGIDRKEATFINPDFPPKLGGGAIAGRYIMQKRAEAEKNGWGFLLIDAGDFYQGTPLGTLTEGEAIIEYMNTVGYDAISLGNHDFDHGWQNLVKLSSLARFPFLAANLKRKSTGELAEFVQPYLIKEVQGIKIGIIGTTLSSTPSMSFPEHIADLDFEPEAQALLKSVPELRRQGVNTIIVETHAWLPYDLKAGYLEMPKRLQRRRDDFSGLSAQEIAHVVPGIDVMFSGHLHRGFYQPWSDPVNHTLVFQNYANGSNLGHVNLYLHRRTGTLAGYDFVSDQGALFTLFEDDFLPDTQLTRQIEALVKKAEAGFDEIIGDTKTNITRSSAGESLMGNLIVESMLVNTRADVAISNHGGLRGEIKAGPITPRDIFNVMPFGNRLVVMNVSGKLLRDLIEDRVSGNSRGVLLAGGRVVIDRSRPDQQRVVQFEIGGRPVNNSQIYRLVVTDYLAEGNSGMGRLTQVPLEQINNTGTLLRQAMIDYVRANTPLALKLDGRWSEIR